MQPAKIVDLFAGPGGLDVAAEKLGVSTMGIELDPAACATRLKAGLETYAGDVRHVGPGDYPDANVLTGGPPCQSFTVAGSGAGRRALDKVLEFVDRMMSGEDRETIVRDLKGLDQRTGLVLEPLRWTLEAFTLEKPYEYIVLEQVPTVLPVWKAYEKALERKGYSVACGILRTEQYGVPQTRKRAVLIARLGAEAVTLPEATHRPYRKGVGRDLGDADLKPWRTMGDALDRDTDFYVVSNYGTGGDPKLRGERTSDEPAATVTGKIFRNRLYSSDGTELDRFDYEEAGRLQTFPADYPWSGNDVGQQIGNAVPPRLAMHVLCAAFGRDAPSEHELESLGKWHSVSPMFSL